MRKTALAFVVMAVSACSASAAYTLEKPIYAKLIFFQDVVMYAQVEGDAMRFAPTPDALKDATPVTGVPEKEGISFKDVAIPVPAEAVPEGIAGAGGQFYFHPKRAKGADGRLQTVPCTHATIWLSKFDDKNVKWNYVFPADSDMLSDIDKAPVARADLSQGVQLDVTGVVKKPNLGVGLKLLSGDLPMVDILCDGTAALVQVAVFDPDGTEILSKSGKLADFGFA